MCIICGPFISKNIAVKVSLWICCKILSKEKKINRKHPPFLKRKAIFHPKVQFILLWHLLTLIKNLSMFVQGFSSKLLGRSFKSLSYRAIYKNWRGFDGVWGEITKLKLISASEGDSCFIVLSWGWGCLWGVSVLQHQLQRLHRPSMTSIDLVWQTQEERPAQPSLWSPDPSEFACSTLRCCLRLGGFEGPAELMFLLVQVLRQWVQQGSWEQNSHLVSLT